jgi:hypothetical protein
MYRQRYSEYPSTKDWMPACAGMTDLMNCSKARDFRHLRPERLQ